MRAPWSIRRRLVLGVLALVALVGVLIGSVSVVFLRQSLVDRLDTQVEEVVRAVAPGAQVPIGPDTLRPGLVVVVANAAGTHGVVVTGPAVARELVREQFTALLEASTGVVSTVDVPGLGAHRVETREFANGTRLAVGLSMDEVDATTWTLALIFASVTIAALIGAAFGAIAIGRVALRPLGRVTETARRVAELQLASGEVAIPERVPDAEADPRTEVGQVGEAFNRMLGHVESALVERQRSEENVRRFVADASHELRTPLASIRGYAELTRRIDGELPPDAVRSLERIEAESIRMTALVEDLLELARLDEGAPLAIGEVELVRLVTDAVGDAYAAAPDHEWELVAPEAPVTLAGDAARLQQVVVNLLANAARHTPAGTSVTVTLAAEPEAVVVTVADNGPGIPTELQPRLFERFARGDASRSRLAGSTGLGLAIVHAVVAAHGGSVAVVSVPGDTRIEVQLPRAAVLSSAPAPSPA